MKSKSILVFLLATAVVLASILTIFIVSHYSSPSDFTGTWEATGLGATSPADPSPTRATFTLTLIQTGNKIQGSHCANLMVAGRTDCANQGQTTLTGTVQGNTAYVDFTSSNLGTGKARLTLANAALKWKIVAAPTTDYAIPNDEILLRK